ncbi:hypothetical protein ACVW00_001855 [Marmoricola sp. URHA0025 HA25]
MKRWLARGSAAALVLAITSLLRQLPTATGDEHPTQPHAPLPVRLGPAKTANTHALPHVASRVTPGPRAALTGASSFDGPALEASPNAAFPPDTQGDIGPTQFVVTLNSRFESYSRSGVPDGALNLLPYAFFATVMTPVAGLVTCNFTSDPHIRYDRRSQRWFVVMIDVPNCDGSLSNRIMVAVSDGPTISSATAGWTFSWFAAPALQFADYPTLGVDGDALYIGINNFSFVGAPLPSDGYVVPVSSVLAGGHITPARLANLPVFTPQGVDDPYGADPAGYFVGVDATNFGELQVVRVADPSSPAADANALIVPATSTPLPVPHQDNAKGNNGRLDGLDDRLLEATMTADGHIWTAHGIGVNAAGGVSSPAPNRDGARWYELGGVSATPQLVQSGTVFDSSATNPRFYWMPTLAVSGQGIMALAGSVAGAALHANAWYAAKLPGDPVSAPVNYTTSTFAYNPPGDTGGTGGRRWGDYSLTRVDPTDNQTIWTIQEYASADDTWGVRIARLQAPRPGDADLRGRCAPECCERPRRADRLVDRWIRLVRPGTRLRETVQRRIRVRRGGHLCDRHLGDERRPRPGHEEREPRHLRADHGQPGRAVRERPGARGHAVPARRPRPAGIGTDVQGRQRLQHDRRRPDGPGEERTTPPRQLLRPGAERRQRGGLVPAHRRRCATGLRGALLHRDDERDGRRRQRHAPHSGPRARSRPRRARRGPGQEGRPDRLGRLLARPGDLLAGSRQGRRRQGQGEGARLISRCR